MHVLLVNDGSGSFSVWGPFLSYDAAAEFTRKLREAGGLEYGGVIEPLQDPARLSA